MAPRKKKLSKDEIAERLGVSEETLDALESEIGDLRGIELEGEVEVEQAPKPTQTDPTYMTYVETREDNSVTVFHMPFDPNGPQHAPVEGSGKTYLSQFSDKDDPLEFEVLNDLSPLVEPPEPIYIYDGPGTSAENMGPMGRVMDEMERSIEFASQAGITILNERPGTKQASEPAQADPTYMLYVVVQPDEGVPHRDGRVMVFDMNFRPEGPKLDDLTRRGEFASYTVNSHYKTDPVSARLAQRLQEGAKGTPIYIYEGTGTSAESPGPLAESLKFITDHRTGLPIKITVLDRGPRFEQFPEFNGWERPEYVPLNIAPEDNESETNVPKTKHQRKIEKIKKRLRGEALFIEGDDGNLRYTGPLDLAMALISRHAVSTVDRLPGFFPGGLGWRVHLFFDGQDVRVDDPNMHGIGNTMKEAWRQVLGYAFEEMPEYDEEGLREALIHLLENGEIGSAWSPPSVPDDGDKVREDFKIEQRVQLPLIFNHESKTWKLDPDGAPDADGRELDHDEPETEAEADLVLAAETADLPGYQDLWEMIHNIT